MTNKMVLINCLIFIILYGDVPRPLSYSVYISAAYLFCCGVS